MKKIPILLALLALAWIPQARAAKNYNGEWSYQALNSGDTNFKVEHKGNKIIFYRVLHPEFQGERYKLEHMYKGTISKNQIRGCGSARRAWPTSSSSGRSRARSAATHGW